MSQHQANPETLAKNFKEFAYVVSHDLGAPVRGMVQFSRLLGEQNPRGLSKDGKLFLSMIMENGEKAQTMLDALLEYSRLNTVVMPFGPVDCNQLVVRWREESASAIVRHKASLEVEPLPVLHADHEQLYKLVKAVLDNALLYHAEGEKPKIQVSATHRQGEWMLHIRDNGIGIASQFQGDIFRPFRRLHTDREYPGVGMGLTLAQKAAEHHNGAIWVDSKPGEGAIFRIVIPERPSSAVSTALSP